MGTLPGKKEVNYTIDGRVEFIPSLNLLRRTEDINHQIRLSAPASRCLQLIIEKHPDIVTQKEFYPYVWGNKGKEKTSNTLYQNILIVRRSLGLVENELCDIIETVPRVGYKINGKIVSQEKDEIQAEKKEENDPVLESVLLKNKVISSDIRSRRTIHFIFYALVFMMLVVSASTYYYGLYKSQDKINYFSSNYVKQISVDGCEYYFNKSMHGDAKKTNDLFGISCNKNYPHVYITKLKNIDNLSYISCKLDLQKTPDARCVSYFMTGKSS
ncbi:winged helix-turn-helix domain-containing protein [Pantoea sp. LMR881]|uniref:winged helix-turn-helix domain-containing protein n=1 Tax=Pantoea sp. LMR881 TaxID=3014336 RepID=UPI0022B00458|nr:winged helix-turn-helix domain-containing protein [Pantoea sp. LMR881]MCZ4061447.1 winged helix-turn-helix domain-containing protein [Pantoea sp. LMR881]